MKYDIQNFDTTGTILDLQQKPKKERKFELMPEIS